MGLFDKFRKKVTDAFSFDEDVENVPQKKEVSEQKPADTTQSDGPISDSSILAQIQTYLKADGTVIRVGDEILLPRFFTIYMSREDFRHWTGIEKVRNALVVYLKKQIAATLREIKAGDQTITPSSVHLSIKADDDLKQGKIDTHGSLEREAGFSEILIEGETPAPADTPVSPPQAVEHTEEPPRKPDGRTISPPPKAKPKPVRPAPAPSPDGGLETVVVGDDAESSSSSPSAELVVETSTDRDRYPINNLPVIVGRLTQGGIDISDEGQHLSRRHFEFLSDENGQLTIRVHEKARNATKVDGVVVKPGESAPVYDGTSVVVAELQMTVHYT